AAGLAEESVTAAGLAGENVTAAGLAGENVTAAGLAEENVTAAAGSAAENLEADVYSKKGGKTAGKNISPQGFTGQYTMIAEGSAGEENIMSVRPSGASHGNTGNFSKYGDGSKNSPEIIRTEKAASEPEPEGSFYILDEQHFPEDHIPGKGQKNAAVPKLLRIILNDAPLTLEKKPDGTAYMLMDILERSGLDFEHLSGPVTITVNGQNAAFLQRLFEGDIVVIRSE
ncbi:MAG: hypothetical protein LIP16_22635, partial [Clostridium sp.]|nr:hypothetical protein [Clostridium sp.]